MAKVTGIGGIFFKSQDPAKLREWYHDRLGLDTNAYGATFEWREASAPEKMGATQWSAFSDTTKYMEPSEKPFMINYRVDDIAALVEDLRTAGVTIVSEVVDSDYGKFAHILDPEGHKIELWEPAAEDAGK